MKIQTIGEPTVIMSNPLSHHNYFGWPSVAKLQDGKIAVVASGYRLGHVCPFGKAVIAYSEDEGESYTAPATVIDTVLDDRDAGIVTFGEKGVVVTSFNNSLEFQRRVAEQSGAEAEKKAYIKAYLDTVSKEEERKVLGSTFRISRDCGKSFGEVYIAPITSPHGPTVLRDGTILWVGRRFSEDDAFAGAEDFVQAYRINMDGTMTYVGGIENISDEYGILYSCEPHALELEDGTIICHIRVQRSNALRNENIFTVYQSESSDGGITWSKPHRILDLTGGAPAHLIRHSSGVLLSVYGYRNAPYGIRVAASYDQGKTWDIDNILWADGESGDLGYPVTVELSDGSLLTVFYAHTKTGEPAVIMQQKWRIESE